MTNGIYIANIYYTFSENGKSGLTATTAVPDGQVMIVSQQLENEELAEKLGTRNRNSIFNIPTDKDSVWLPYYAIKTVLTDQDLYKSLSNQFRTFIEPQVVLPEAVFTVGDGDFFRCAGEAGSPKPIEQYQYYLLQAGYPTAIPNYKTLEVLLYERNKSALDIKVIEESECNNLMALGESTVADKSAVWIEQYKDFTSFERFQQLAAVSTAALAVAGAATAAVQQQINVTVAQSNATQAAATAANLQAAASLAAAQAAQSQSQAAIAAAQAQQAVAEQAAQEAAALQAQLNLQIASLPTQSES